jgi:hypothetical protein
MLTVTKNGCNLAVSESERSLLEVLALNILKGQYHNFFCFSFFHESSSPKPLKITLGPFRIFSKIRGGIREGQGAPPVSTTPVANLPPV